MLSGSTWLQKTVSNIRQRNMISVVSSVPSYSQTAHETSPLEKIAQRSPNFVAEICWAVASEA